MATRKQSDAIDRWNAAHMPDLENTARLPTLPDVTHLSPQQQRVFAALAAADKLIGAMMPGVRYIALQDYKALNDTPLAISACLRELADPNTTDAVAEQCRAP